MHNYDVNSPFGTNVNIRPLEPGYGFRGVPFAVIMISSCFKYILAYMVFMPNITTNHAITYTNTDTGGGGGGVGEALKVSVLSGLNFRENVRAFFPQGHRKLSITSRCSY